MDRPLFVFVINAALTEPLVSGIEMFYQQHGRLFDVRVFATHDIEEETIATRTIAGAFERADMVFLDIRGGGKSLGVCTRVLPETCQPVALLLGGSPDLMSLLRLGSFTMKALMERRRQKPGDSSAQNTDIRSIQRMMNMIEKSGDFLPFGKLKHARNWAKIMRYWQQGGPENIRHLLGFSAREYLGIKIPKPPEPKEYPAYGIYDPIAETTYTNIADYRDAAGYDPNRPTVGLLFYGGMHFGQSVVPARAYTRELKEREMNVLPVFAVSGYNLAAISDYFFENNAPAVDAMIYIQWFQLTTFTGDDPNAGITALQRLGVPVFCSCPMFGREVDKWADDDQGLSPVEIMTTVILPELDGMIEPLPAAGLVESESAVVAGTLKTVVPIADRIERACRRIEKWIALRRKQNPEKRVAFIIYDNPPGEDNLGSAGYIDTFASLKAVFSEMERQGYTVSSLPENEALHEYLLARNLVNNPGWQDPATALSGGKSLDPPGYLDLLSQMVCGNEVAEAWGDPPGEIMTAKGRFVLPAVEFGNVLIGVQPSRGHHSDPETLTHDKTLPPHHQYTAFYRWLEDHWRPDCVVHVGTHGTLEFLKGKEAGMSARCFPEALLGDVPHLYFYHVVNASEATIAKRRSLGVLISYNSPSFAAGGLYDEYESLDQLISEYVEALTLEPTRAERLQARIFEKAQELNFNLDTVEAVQEEIAMMKRSIIPKGLHLLGESHPEADRITYAVFFLRYDRGEVPSLHRLLAEEKGYDYEALLAPTRADNADPKAGAVLEKIEAEVETAVKMVFEQERYPETEPARTAVNNAVAAARKLDGRFEMENFFHGLCGRYVPPGLGGDPLRNPEVLPTGRNSFQFDPRLVPSEEACRRGAEIAENTLAHYFQQNGSYPNSTAVILWGFETTKTRGETVGQVLAYIGVRVVGGFNPYHKKLEAISASELGRPRVDCLVQICGFFRDMFPNVMDLINRAFSLAAEQDEPDDTNFVRKNTGNLKKTLADSVPHEQIDKIAAGRIYGPRAGEYGTRTTHLIETGAWQSEEEITELFSSTMSHLYADNIHGVRQPAAYRSRLAGVDVVSQVRDTHEYEIMDLDHYYEFFGGLSRTVESVRGKAPAMLITDTTKEVIRTETVGESLNRGVRTRLLNPKWIDELLKHEYHGAQKISDRVEYLVGFAATTHSVENWVWSGVTDRYIRDRQRFEQMTQNNRYAVESIIKRLFEADQRGYWHASDEEKSLLRNRYLELEGMIEERIET